MKIALLIFSQLVFSTLHSQNINRLILKNEKDNAYCAVSFEYYLPGINHHLKKLFSHSRVLEMGLGNTRGTIEMAYENPHLSFESFHGGHQFNSIQTKNLEFFHFDTLKKSQKKLPKAQVVIDHFGLLEHTRNPSQVFQGYIDRLDKNSEIWIVTKNLFHLEKYQIKDPELHFPQGFSSWIKDISGIEVSHLTFGPNNDVLSIKVLVSNPADVIIPPIELDQSSTASKKIYKYTPKKRPMSLLKRITSHL